MGAHSVASMLAGQAGPPSPRRLVAAWTVAVVAAGVLVALPSAASAAGPDGVAAAPVESVATGSVPVRKGAVSQTDGQEWSAPGDAVWPAAGVVEVDLSASVARASGGPAAVRGLVRAGSAPVWLDAVSGSVGAGRAGRVRVVVADRAVTTAAGVHGVVVSLARSDGQASVGLVDVAVDFSGFRSAFGADFGWQSPETVEALIL